MAPMLLPFRNLRPRNRDAATPIAVGFTMLELMVTVAIGALLVGAAASMVGAHIRSGLTMEFAQGLNNDMTRLSYFLGTEIAEGDAISYGQPISGCTGATGNALFSIRVPNTGATGVSLPTTTIDYYVSGSGPTASLNRCGPPINSNGTLNFAGTRIAAPVGTNTTLTLANTTDTKAITYDLTMRDPSASRSLSRASISHRTKVSLIN